MYLSNMIPKQYNFQDAYQNDGIRQTVLRFTDKNGVVRSMSGSAVRLSLVDINNKVQWTFSSTGDGNSLITFDAEGNIILPEIKEWAIKPAQYRYDMQVKDGSGFVTTYLKGTWNVLADVTKLV